MQVAHGRINGLGQSKGTAEFIFFSCLPHQTGRRQVNQAPNKSDQNRGKGTKKEHLKEIVGKRVYLLKEH